MAGMRKGIVAGYDGSPGSILALRWAAIEALARRTSLTVCFAWAPGYLTLLGEPVIYDLARQRGEEIIAPGLRYAESQLRPGAVSPLLARGSAAEVLCGESVAAEMVVVGARGRGGLDGMRLGSVAHAMLHHAPCPVSVIHARASGPTRTRAWPGRSPTGTRAGLAPGSPPVPTAGRARPSLWRIPCVPSSRSARRAAR